METYIIHSFIWIAIRFLAERNVENNEYLKQESRQRCLDLNLVTFEHKTNRDLQ
jgi:hypothetical protein